MGTLEERPSDRLCNLLIPRLGPRQSPIEPSQAVRGDLIKLLHDRRKAAVRQTKTAR